MQLSDEQKRKISSTIDFDLTSDYYYGSFLYDFVSIKMKEYIDESNIGKEVQLRAEFDSAYRQDNGVVAILLTKRIFIQQQD